MERHVYEPVPAPRWIKAVAAAGLLGVGIPLVVLGYRYGGWAGAAAPVVLAVALVGLDRTQFPFEDPLLDFDMERGGVEATEYIYAYERNVWRTLGRPLELHDLVMVLVIAAVVVFAFVVG